jgi:tripartite-type tricarboxylate transporter receptor subunit TctC
MRPWTRAALAATAAMLAWMTPGWAIAQAWPTSPVRIVVSSAPGGIDTIVRLIGPSLTERLGQQVVVENRPGANGILGVEAVKSAAPDGHTVLFTTISTLVINPFVYKKLPYHPLRDLEPVARHAAIPMLWVAHPATRFKSLRDVVNYARAHPGKLTFANSGNGSFSHLLEEAFRRKNGIDARLVPYKTTPQAMVDTIGGHVDIVVDNVSNLTQHIVSGKLVPLGVTSRERARSLPNVASWLEDGTGEFEAIAWYAFMAPKGTPAAIVQRLNTEINAAIQLPSAQQYLQSIGAKFDPFTPRRLHDFIQEELDRYGAIVRSANVELQ